MSEGYRRMCHHFFLKMRQQTLKEVLQAQYAKLATFDENGFFPLSEIPLLRHNSSEQRELVTAQWGLLPFWWKSSPGQKSRTAFQRKTFNARSETVDIKPTFREAFKRRRCVIPATMFVEAGQLFKLADSPLMLFAGLWEKWSDGEEQVESCTILTTHANPLIARYHPKQRMPVILPDDNAVQAWLNPDLTTREPLEHLFIPLNEEKFIRKPESNPGLFDSSDTETSSR